jgi:hypothetical protein
MLATVRRVAARCWTNHDAAFEIFIEQAHVMLHRQQVSGSTGMNMKTKSTVLSRYRS